MMNGKVDCLREALSLVKTASSFGPAALDDIEQRIVQSLGEKPSSSISEVAERLSINRSTASKYLHVLKAKGRVACRQVGPVKLWSVGGSI
jgi:DNA-binding MarR family transcriptional regulator